MAAALALAALAAEGAETCRLAGRVATAAGEPLGGVTVRFSNGLPAQTTDSSGAFETVAPADGTRCTVTPSKRGWEFTPAERSVWLSGDEAEASFRAAPAGREKTKSKDGDSWTNAVELVMDGPTKTGDIWYGSAQNWFYFKVVTAGTYIVESWPGTLTDNYIWLYNSSLKVIAADDDSGEGLMAKITRTLSAGTYYVLVQGYSWSLSGTYTIGVRTPGPTLSNFAINGGALATLTPQVTLNHVAQGTPAQFMASESPTFAGAAWTPYVANPPFTLSAGNETKTVYLKVRDANNRESNVLSDSILLNEPIPVELTVNAPPTLGNLWPAGDLDWFYFTAAAPGMYTIETWAGSLTDNVMGLYQGDQATLIATDDNSGEGGRMARIVRILAPGTYFIRVVPLKAKKTGTYLIRVMTGEPQLTVLNPYGDPTANTAAAVGNSEVVFSARIPATLEVACSFAVNAPAVPDLANKVRVCISPVGGSALQWMAGKKTPSPWTGSAAGQPAGAHAAMGKALFNPKTGRYEAKAVFTGLPANNADFGPKTIWVQIVDGANVIGTAQQPIEVFYPRLVTNNAGAGPDRGPNWFYFWKTGNVCGATTGWQYLRGRSYGVYYPGEDHVNVRDAAPTRNSGPETYRNDFGSSVTVTGQGVGPQCCTEVIAHEFQHKWFYDNWDALIAAAEADGENNGDDYDDPDDDGIPNLFEPGFLGIATDPNDPDTFNMGGSYSSYGDEELRCRKVELAPGLTADPAADWAFPGSNSYPRYGGN
ncbi:MAG TPA: PPC domain-containing protein [Planctomycetota bacterium]|nr:PPC domain-containing protein [Planctomycetota bacterium]HRR79480.1 PPC domain-containing protein [Planctomycetota bacterium]HRT93326.1 PPC domain-containing protein [Planctomycetota bacterium]